MPSRKLGRGVDRADAPIEEALALIVRERLTGMSPPAAAARLVDLWRPLIENRAGRELDRLERLIENQARFGDVVHDLLDSLDMGEDRSSEADEDEADQGDEERQKELSGKEGEGAESRMPKRSRRCRGLRRGDVRHLGEAARRCRRKCPTMPRWGIRRRQPSRAGRAGRGRTSRAVRVPALHAQVRRGGGGRGLVRAEELDRLRGYLDKQLSICRAWWRGWPTGCSAA